MNFLPNDGFFKVIPAAVGGHINSGRVAGYGDLQARFCLWCAGPGGNTIVAGLGDVKLVFTPVAGLNVINGFDAIVRGIGLKAVISTACAYKILSFDGEALRVAGDGGAERNNSRCYVECV